MLAPHLKVIRLMLLFAILLSFFSCAKDSDILSEALLETPSISSVEERSVAEEMEAPDENSNGDLVTKTFAFTPISDAYVQEDQGFDHSIIRLQEDYRTSYLKFDLTALDSAIITNAVLQLTIDSDDGDGTIIAGKASSNDWAEEDLSESNAPSAETVLGSINKKYNVGVTEKVVLDISNIEPEVTTIVLSHNSGNDLAFASKEHPDKIGPKMVVTYQVPAGTPDIVQEEEVVENDTPTPPPAEDNNTNQEASNQYPEPDYFVTTSGNANNDGRTEANAWSIEHAFSNARAGDVVYVKAGNYGNKELIADNSGTAEKPIQFIGYTNSPGDLMSENGSTFSYGDQIDANKMPLLEGGAINGLGKGTGIKVNEHDVNIENFQITKYEIGLVGTGNDCNYKNIIVSQIGDFNPAHSYPTGTSNAFLNYSGLGIVVEGNNSTLFNSFALNCGAQAITIKNTTNFRAEANKVYADDDTNPTDYYFLIGAETINSTVVNTKVVRVGQLTHFGHGIVFKGNGDIRGNTVDGFEITNTNLEVQFPKTTENVIKNGTIIKENNVNSTTPQVAGINLANGSHGNSFQNIDLTNCSILFQDWNDGLAGDVNDSSDNNSFNNVNVSEARAGISFNFFNVNNHNSGAENNVFQDCTFSNLEYLFESDRPNSGTQLLNCTITNVDGLSLEVVPGGPSYSVNATYQNCSWNNIGFTAPDN